MMGYRLMENFRSPFAANTIAGFWRRWNISLISWFRDYLYIPLGGSRVSFVRHQLNIMVVFLVSGLWHGAAWTFVLYGALHGGYLLCGSATVKMRDTLWSRVSSVLPSRPVATLRYTLGVLFTFHLVSLSIFFFRAPDLDTALTMIRNMFVVAADAPSPLSVVGGYQLALAGLAIAILELGQWIERRGKLSVCLSAPSSRSVRWSAYYALAVVILMFGVYNNEEFIYFQF